MTARPPWDGGCHSQTAGCAARVSAWVSTRMAARPGALSCSWVAVCFTGCHVLGACVSGAACSLCKPEPGSLWASSTSLQDMRLMPPRLMPPHQRPICLLLCSCSSPTNGTGLPPELPSARGCGTTAPHAHGAAVAHESGYALLWLADPENCLTARRALRRLGDLGAGGARSKGMGM